MNFIEAIKAIELGEKVRIKGDKYWIDKYLVQACSCGKLHNTAVHKATTAVHIITEIDDTDDIYCFRIDDYLAQWEIYQEEPKLHTFEEAITALKEGKKIKRSGTGLTFRLNPAEMANDWIIIEG